MPSRHQFTIALNQAGNRLDKFLTAQLVDTSRSQVQKIIRVGQVTVNGKPASVHQFLKSGDVITVDKSRSREQGSGSMDRIRPADSPAPYSLLPTPTIIHEDDDLLVVEKPAGLLVHPTARQELQTLTAWLLDRYPQLHAVGESHRPGIVHRLDRDVSGLMVVAKTSAAYQHLVSQFSQRQVKKTYAAIVYGTLKKTSGVITRPIGRSAKGKFVAHTSNPATELAAKDRPAQTTYRVVQSAPPYSLLEVTTDTGRPHQIRAHCAAIGHPIVGDREYGPRKPFHHDGRKKIKTVTLDRLLLHVTRLAFTGPDGKHHSLTSPFPTVFTTFLREQPVGPPFGRH